MLGGESLEIMIVMNIQINQQRNGNKPNLQLRPFSRPHRPQTAGCHRPEHHGGPVLAAACGGVQGEGHGQAGKAAGLRHLRGGPHSRPLPQP